MNFFFNLCIFPFLFLFLILFLFLSPIVHVCSRRLPVPPFSVVDGEANRIGERLPSAPPGKTNVAYISRGCGTKHTSYLHCTIQMYLLDYMYSTVLVRLLTLSCPPTCTVRVCCFCLSARPARSCVLRCTALQHYTVLHLSCPVHGTRNMVSRTGANPSRHPWLHTASTPRRRGHPGRSSLLTRFQSFRAVVVASSTADALHGRERACTSTAAHCTAPVQYGVQRTPSTLHRTSSMEAPLASEGREGRERPQGQWR
jgi:hypothetical protein